MTNLLAADGGGSDRDKNLAINQALKGKINSTGTVTLTHDAGSTTVANALVSKSSVILFMPLTAHAAAELGNGTMYVAAADITDGTSFAVTHANNSQTDRAFGYAILG